MLNKKVWFLIMALAVVCIAPFAFMVYKDMLVYGEKQKPEKHVISTNIIANGVVCVTYFDAAKEKPVTMDCVEPVIRGHKESLDVN